MTKEKLDGIADLLLLFFPLFYKKLMKGWDDGAGKKPPSHHRYMILSIVTNTGPMPISEIGRRLYISKPHMTFIIDQLIAEGKMQRLQDDADRRVVKISITEDGQSYMKEYRHNMKENIKRNLSELETEDIDALSASLEDIRSIFAKLEEKRA